MQTFNSFNKHVAASEATIVEINGSNPNGFVLFVQNQDAIATLILKVQTSSDGTEWADIEFPLSGGGTSTSLSVVAGAAQSIRITSTAPRLRLRGYGDLEAAFSITSFRSTPVDSASFTLTI